MHGTLPVSCTSRKCRSAICARRGPQSQTSGRHRGLFRRARRNLPERIRPDRVFFETWEWLHLELPEGVKSSGRHENWGRLVRDSQGRTGAQAVHCEVEAEAEVPHPFDRQHRIPRILPTPFHVPLDRCCIGLRVEPSLLEQVVSEMSVLYPVVLDPHAERVTTGRALAQGADVVDADELAPGWVRPPEIRSRPSAG